MGFTKPQVRAKQPKSQATPLANDILGFLQEAFSSGDFGSGIGTQQKAAGENISQFISDRQDPDMFAALMGPLREAFNLDTDRSAAEVREGFGTMGSRFSSGLAREEGRMRGERDTRLDAMISELFLGEQQNLLGAIGAQQQFGTQAIEPFLRFGEMGVLPEELYGMKSKWDRYSKFGGEMVDIVKALGTMMAGAGGAGGAGGGVGKFPL